MQALGRSMAADGRIRPMLYTRAEYSFHCNVITPAVFINNRASVATYAIGDASQ